MRGRRDKWLADVVNALESLGEASLYRIYREVRQIKAARGEVYPNDGDAIIRRTLENFCSDSLTYLKSYDLFRMAKGKGQGIWSIDPPGLSRYRSDTSPKPGGLR